MKALIFLFFIESAAQAAPWVGPSQVDSYFQRVVPFIQDAKAKQQAEQALRSMTQAEHSDGFIKGVIELSKINAPAAKVAALYFYPDPQSRESFSSSIHFTLPELPLLISWIVTNGLTLAETLDTQSALIKSDPIEMLAGKVNEILVSKNMPSSRCREPGNGFAYYMPEELRKWALEQIQWSLKNTKWSNTEKDFILEMMTKLKSVRIPPASASRVLIDINPSISTISEQSKSTKQFPTSQLIEFTSQRYDVMLWLLAIIAAITGLWLFMRQK